MKIYTVQQILKIYGSDVSRTTILQAEKAGSIPIPSRKQTGTIQRRIWESADLPAIGERYGFLKKPEQPQCITVFTTKGGVLKTTLALNLARLSALHNIKTCIVGLDLQGDITNAAGFNQDVEQIEDMDIAIAKINRSIGIDSLFNKETSIYDLIQPLDMPTLSIIPETAGLAMLDKKLHSAYHREYWLKENVVKPLKKRFDLIVIDCSPNWNLLISNALVACDSLISPIECRINQFRNLEVFQQLIEQFKAEMKLDFKHIYIPTRFMSTRKLSSEIRTWYLKNIKNITHSVIREATQGEEATASYLSVPEYASSSILADEMRELMRELWNLCIDTKQDKTTKKKNFLQTPTH